MTFTFNLSVRDQKVQDIIDAWKQQGNAAFRIAEAIKRAYAIEQKATKLDSFLSQSKLELLPPAFDFWSREDLKDMPAEDLEKLYKVLTANRDVVLRMIQTAKVLA
jgi:hypothetical protein